MGWRRALRVASLAAASMLVFTAGITNGADPLGSAWEQLPRDTTAFAGPYGRIADVVRLGSGSLVAVGDQTGAYDPSTVFVPHGATWTSPDGLTWTLSPEEPSMAGVSPWRAAVGSAGIVMIGGWYTTTPAADPHSRIWTSADGVTWSVVDTLPDAATILNDVVATPDGYLVVGPGSGGSAVWSSADGRTWTVKSTIPTPARVLSIAATTVGYVAVGETGASGAGIWTSPDAVTWTQATGATFADPGRVWDIAEWSHGLIAVGDTIGVAPGPTATVWLSADGTTWERVTADAGTRTFMALTITDGYAVALSHVQGTDGRMIWTSPDGHAWTAASMKFAHAGDAAVYGAAAVGDLLVAGGASPGGPSIWVSPPQGLLPDPTPRPNATPPEPGPTMPLTSAALPATGTPTADGLAGTILLTAATLGAVMGWREAGRRQRRRR